MDSYIAMEVGPFNYPKKTAKNGETWANDSERRSDIQIKA